MKLWIPELKQQIRLIEDWNFDLFWETRNQDLIDAFGFGINDMIEHPEFKENRFLGYVLPEWKEGDAFTSYEDIKVHPRYRDFRAYYGKAGVPYRSVTISSGSVLSFDRIYIRKGNEDYSSVTFFIKSSDTPGLDWKKYSKKRFWAKLKDVNKIEMEILTPS